MTSAATAAFNAFHHNGLKQACHASKHAARHSPSTNALPLSTVPGEARHASSSAETKPLFTYTFERRPKPVNVTTLTPTRIHAEDATHPFHVKVNRRLKMFDPDRLHWRIHVPVDVSRKPAVRRWAMKRVREAFRLELKARGFMWDGTRKSSQSGSLKGALLVVLPKDSRRALEVSYEEVKSNVTWLIGKVIEAQPETRNHSGQKRVTADVRVRPYTQ